MKGIVKRVQEPEELANYRASFSHVPAKLTWVKFKKQAQRREAVKTALREDQRGLCAFCENSLISCDESVEHFVARHTDHGQELTWGNLLLCCAGGERPLPEQVADAGTRYSSADHKTCGHSKLESTEAILCPLHLPHTPRLFRFKSETGEIVPDGPACRQAGIDQQVAADTIRVLNLHAGRLNNARLALLNMISEELAEAGAGDPFTVDRELELASDYLPTVGPLPAFFTTLRFALGEGAELHLSNIGFRG